MLAGDLIYKVGANIQGFETEMGKVSKTLNSLDRVSQKALSGFDKMGERLSDVGKIMTASLSLPIAGIGVAATKMASDFELSMRQVTSLLGDAADSSFKPLSNAVLDLSRKMGIDAVQAAQALYETISADIPQDNAISFLETASKASIAGVTDTKVAVDGLTTVIKAFGLQVTDADKVADAMFQTVNIGKVTFPQLAASIGEAAGMANALGVSYTELMASGATITKQGQTFGEAMTQVSSALRAMIDPSETMRDLFSALRVESGKALIEAYGFEGALQKLREAAHGNEVVFNAAFGRIEGFRAALSLTGDKAQGAAKDLDSITHSTGAMGKAFEQIDESTKRQFDRFIVQIKDTAIQLGTALLPSVNALMQASKPMVDVIASAVGWFTKLPEPVQMGAFAFAAMVAAAGPLLYGLGTLVTGFTGLYQAINFLAKAGPVLASTMAGPVLSAFTGLGTAVKNVAFAFQNDMIGALTPGEAIILRVGQAAVIAGAAFAAFYIIKDIVVSIRDLTTGFIDFDSIAKSVKASLVGLNEANSEAPDKFNATTVAVKEATKEAGYLTGVLERISTMDWWKTIEQGAGPVGLLAGSLKDLKQLVGVFPDMDAAAKKTSQSMQDYINKSTKVSDASLKQLAASKNLTSAMSDQERGMKAATGGVVTLGEEYEKWGKKVAATFKKAEDGPKSFQDTVRDLSRDESFQKTLQSWENAIGISLPKITGEMSRSIGVINGEWQILEREWSEIDVSALQSVLSVMGEFPPVINSATTSIEQLNSQAALIGSVTGDVFAEARTGAAQFGGVLATLPPMVQQAGTDALTKASQQGKVVFDEQKKIWNDISREVSTNVTNAAQHITGILLGTEKGSIGDALKTLGGTVLTALEEPFIHAFSNIIEKGVKKLMGWLLSETGLSGALNSVSGALGGLLGIGGGAASSAAGGAAGAAGSVGSAAGGIAGSVGGAAGSAGSLGSSLAGGALSGVLSALGSIIGASMMGGDLGHIEENTRKAERQLSEGVQPRLDAYLPKLESIDSYIWGAGHGLLVDISSSLDMIEEDMDAAYQSLRDINDMRFAEVKASTEASIMVQKTGSESIVQAIRELAGSTLKVSGTVNVGNISDFSASLRMAGLVTA